MRYGAAQRRTRAAEPGIPDRTAVSRFGRYTPLIERAIRRSARRGTLSVLHDAGRLDILKHGARG